MSTAAFDIPEKRSFRTDEVAEICGVSRRTVQRWCESGFIDFIRIGPKLIKIKRECIIKIISLSE